MAFRKFMVLHLTRPLLSCKGILLNVGENFSHQKPTEQNGLIWNFLIFDHLKFFRISDFEFRTCKFVYTWRPLRRCSGHALRFAAVIVSPISLPSP
jgi:hypothetical protein